MLRTIDHRAFRGADLVVADTEAHAAFFRQAFDLPEERVAVALVGAEEPLFRPAFHPPEPFHVLFVGKLIPLHGARDDPRSGRARPPRFPLRVVGDGQEAHLLERRPPNVEHVPWVPYEELPEAYRAAGCGLGVFGTGEKAARVIRTRSSRRSRAPALLSLRTPDAARELLADGADALLVRPGDPVALADAVRRLAADDALASRIGAAGRATFETYASEEVLGARWRDLLERALAGAGAMTRPARLVGAGAGVRRRARRAGRAPAPRVLDGPLRRREPRPGGVVDRARRPARRHRPLGHADLAARRPLRPDRRCVRALWWIWPDASLLLVSQALAVASGAIPVYLLGRRHLGSDWAAAGFGLAYLLHPATQWLVLDDFHPVALATPLLLWASSSSTRDGSSRSPRRPSPRA